jgi:hypothetical protein
MDMLTQERLVVLPSRRPAVALCDAGLRARLGSSLVQVPLPTTPHALPFGGRSPLSVRANRSVATVLARCHGLGVGMLTNVHALELAHACTCRAPTHAHTFSQGKRTSFTFRFPQPS